MKLREWTGAAIDPTLGSDPPDGVDWTPVSVPGRPSAFADSEAAAYRTTFSDPRSDDESRAELVLDGAFAHVTIWLNGRKLGDHDAYFVPARFAFEPDAENELIVECRAPDDRFGGVHDTDQVPADAAVPGIWWDARVDTYPASYVSELDVTPRPDAGEIHAVATIDAAEPVDDRLTFSLRPEGFRGGGMMERSHVTAEAGERVRVERTIDVRDPSMWWTHDRGDQSRYTVSARFDGTERSRTVGLTTIERDGEAIVLNGRRIRLRGFNVLPTDDPADAVERAADAGANVVRAHAHVPSHELHAAADERGVLVWQDLPLTGEGGYDIGRGADLAEALVAEYDHHPSVGIYGVHDDPRKPFDGNLGNGLTARYRLRWRAWRTSYNDGPDEQIAERLPDDRIVVPVTGPIGTDPDAATVYPGWEYGTATDLDWLLDRFDLPSLVAEFGAGGPGEGDDVAAVTEGQHEQATTVKSVAESLRRRGADAAIAFALRDGGRATPATVQRGSRRYDAGLGVLAHDGTEKAAYDRLADSFQAVVPVLDEPPSPGDLGVTVLNDGPESIDGTLTWTAGEESGSESVSVDALDSTDAGPVTIPTDADEIELSLSGEELSATNRYRL